MKLTRKIKLNIRNSFEEDAEHLISKLESEFQKFNFKTKQFKNGLNYYAPFRFAPNSEENLFVAMKIFRKGTIAIIETKENKIEIVSRTSLKHLIINAVIVGLLFSIMALFYIDDNSKDGFMLFGLACSVAILIIGSKTIKNGIDTILESIKF